LFENVEFLLSNYQIQDWYFCIESLGTAHFCHLCIQKLAK